MTCPEAVKPHDEQHQPIYARYDLGLEDDPSNPRDPTVKVFEFPRVQHLPKLPAATDTVVAAGSVA